ncbi:hypothetical protein JCM17845_16900 [Iodidimonas gelatinilytica]|uniref:Uncharacterized protein n=1 Tax=Iodidimonas gelatinilytica TaxID=1236966 RepID=A0A5A7MZ43_9PROT|nr:tetratricopeptide repeat protein [Iodidimonas gelatinilytica]GER01067.1 hypothetical protein JCM17845_16900 [Iodidimonas gelatinilytica]
MSAPQTAFVQSLQSAMSLARAGRLGEAQALLEQLLQKMPNQPDALQLMGLVKRGQGDQKAAISCFEGSLAANPKQAHVQNNLGNAQAALGQGEKAIASYRKAIALQPDYADARLNLALALLDTHAAHEARTLLEDTVTLAPNNPRMWSAFGRALRACDRTEEAIVAFKRALSVKADYVPALHNLAVAYTVLDRPQEALALLDRCTVMQPAQAMVHYNRGNALYELDRVEEAIAAYERCISLMPDYLEGHDTLNKLLWQHGLTDRYLASYAWAVSQVPSTVGLWVDWADKLMLAGRVPEAQTVLTTALKQGLDAAVIHHRLGRVLCALGQGEQGCVSYQKALSGSDAAFHQRDVHMDLARHLIEQAEYDAALEEAAAVLTVNSYDQEAIAYQAVAWQQMGDRRAAELLDFERLVKSYKLDAPEGFESIEAFNKSLLSVLADLHKAKQHPAEQTLRGGSQTMGSLFAKDLPEIKAIKAQIEKAVMRYIADMPDDSDHVLFRRKTEAFRFSGSWSVRLCNHGFHVNHVHSQGWISSCYYVDLPDAVDQDEEAQQGWIKFGETSMNLGERERIGRVVRPQSGLLVLFPSYMYHGTIPFEDDTPRTTIAFDVVPD